MGFKVVHTSKKKKISSRKQAMLITDYSEFK